MFFGAFIISDASLRQQLFRSIS